MKTVSAKQSRAVAEARRARHAQRNVLPRRAVGNPTADVLREAWAEHKAKKG